MVEPEDFGVAWYSKNYWASGGVGNPGSSANVWGGAKAYKASDGTGGLLMIYGNSVYNCSKIYSNGTDNSDHAWLGGASGGGSINLFYKKSSINDGKIIVKGGYGASGGGNGGNGTVTIGNISIGTFVKDEDKSENK